MGQQQGPHLKQLLIQHLGRVGIGFGNVRPPVRQSLDPGGKPALTALQKNGHVGGSGKTRLVRLIGLLGLGKPSLHIRLGAEEFIQPLQAHKEAVLGIEQAGKAVEGALPIAFLQHLVPYLLLEHRSLGLVCGPEGRVQPGGVKMPPEHMGAKGVDGGNVGLAHPGGRAVEALGLIFPAGFPGHLGQPGTDALFHFPGRRPGKGDHQETVQGAAFRHQLGDALGEHGGLAAACRSGYQ